MTLVADATRRFGRNRLAVLGLGIVAVLVLVAAAASTSAATVSSRVAGHASASSSVTGRFCWMERPRSPRARWPTYAA